MKTEQLLIPIFLVQVLLGFRVVWRMIRTSGGKHITPALRNSEGTLTRKRPSSLAINKQVSLEHEQVSILVPVLNERTRLKQCLDGLIEQGKEVAEIIVVDGGSVDGTQAFVSSYAQRDPRICLIDASPIP
ncbi:MAG TPA: glycosyltransferase, partial [Ktedonobacteraceae bacterium]|nr:glycosyltransferase [Ktedonobacteraceae bacterium]